MSNENIDTGWTTLDLDNNEEVEVEVAQDDLLEDMESLEMSSEHDHLNVELEEEEETEESIEDSKEDPEDDSGTEELQEKSDEKPRKPKRKSRARERIQQLANEKNELKRQLEEQQAKLQELQNTSVNSEKNSLEMHKDLLGNQIDALKGNLRAAIEEGDIDKQIDLNAKMADLNVDLRVTEAKLDKASRGVQNQNESNTATQQPMPELPQEMQYFIEENPWVVQPSGRNDRKKIMFLREATQDLLKEGYSEHDADFYEELEVMLEEKFGQTAEDDVEYETEDSTSSSRQTLKAKKKKTKNTSSNNRKQQSSVSGTSTPPTSKKNKVTLTRDERVFARKMNLTDEQYAKRKRNKQNSEGGWTTIV